MLFLKSKLLGKKIMTTLVVLLALIGGAWLFRAYQRGHAPFGEKEQARQINQSEFCVTSDAAGTREFQAVEVRPGSKACRSAREQRETRYLSTSAPPLPLAGCDVEVCHCRYMKYQDRRAADDRRMSYGLLGQYERGLKGERRDLDDRRAS